MNSSTSTELCKSYGGITFIIEENKFMVRICHKQRWHRDEHSYILLDEDKLSSVPNPETMWTPND